MTTLVDFSWLLKRRCRRILAYSLYDRSNLQLWLRGLKLRCSGQTTEIPEIGERIYLWPLPLTSGDTVVT